MNPILLNLAVSLDFGEKMLRSLCAWICKIIYPLIAKFFQLFITIAQLDVLSSDTVQPIYQRITMILAIVMIFFVTFEFIKYIIEPDQFSDKEKGASKIVYKMIAVVVLIAFVPKMFTWAYKVQNVVIENQVFSKVILGKVNVDSKAFGNNFATNMLSVFYNIDDANKNEDCEGISCGSLVSTNLSTLQQSGELPYFSVGINDAIKTESTINNKTVVMPKINFNGLLAVIVGGFLLYVLLLYSIDLGARFAKMIFLQVVAPIPIMGYLLPKKDSIFDKWAKQCLSTYLDLFIRLGIIYFALLICQILGNAYEDKSLFSATSGLSSGMMALAYVFIIMGLLLFVHKLPDLLKDLFPKSAAASGNFGLKAGERVAPLAARALGTGLGATRLVRGAVGRGVSTYKRNKEERERTGMNRREQRLAHKENRKQYQEARKNLRENRRTYNRALREAGFNEEAVDTQTRENFNKSRATYERARSQVADDKSKKYRSVALNALAGGVAGATTGMSTGFGATKLEDVGKKYTESGKKIKEAQEARTKWLDAGGGSDFDRMVTNIEKNLGISTEAERIAYETKQMEGQIKATEALAKTEASLHEAEEKNKGTRLKKIEEGKISHKVAAKTYGSITSDGSLSASEIFGRARANKTTAEEKLKIALKDGQQQGETEEEYKARITRLQDEKAKAERDEIKIRDDLGKEVSGYVIKTVLGNYATEEEKNRAINEAVSTTDNGLVQGTFDQFNKLEIFRRNQASCNALEEQLKAAFPSVAERCIRAIYEPSILTSMSDKEAFDTWDCIQKAANNVADNRKLVNAQRQDTLATIQTSSATDAAKADDAASGKK